MNTAPIRLVVCLSVWLAWTSPPLRGDEAAAGKPPLIRDVAQDGDGQVWGIAAGGLFRFIDGQWRGAAVNGLTAKNCFPLGLVRRADGAVVCLWRGSGEDRFFSVQRGTPGDPPTAIAAAIPHPGPGTPQLFADSRNNVWLTGSSPDICRLSPDGTVGCPHVISLEECAGQGQTDPGSTRVSGYNKVVACEDAQGRVYFHSEGLAVHYASLRSVLVCDGAAFTLRDPIPADYRHRQITVLAPKDAGHLWIGIFGDGLFTLDTATWQMERMPEQPAETRGSQEIFPRGADWFFVLRAASTTSPRSLWRLRAGRWDKLVDAVDASFLSDRQNRPWVRGTGGNFLGSSGNGLWFVPDDGSPRSLNWQQGFPLADPLRLVALADHDRWLGVDPHGEVWVGRPDDLLARAAASGDPRIAYVRSERDFFADERGHLWGLRAADTKTLSEWNGEKWISHDLPGADPSNDWYRRVMGVDRSQRVWLRDAGAQEHAILLYEPGPDRWQRFESLEKALEAQVPLGQAAELPVSEYSEDLARFGPHGQIGHLTGEEVIDWFDGEVWRHWRRGDLHGPDARYGFDGPPFFTPAGNLAINIHRSTWERRGENDWQPAAANLPGYADYEVRTPSARRLTLPPGAVTRTPESVVLDSRGVYWLTWHQQLYRCREGLCAPVFPPGEAQPFIDGRRLSGVLIDGRGNAFLRSRDRHEYVVLSAPGRPPRTSLEIVAPAGAGSPPDRRVIRLSTDAAPIEGKVRFDWRLDEGAWQALAAEGQAATVTLEALRGGPHRFEARSFDPALQTNAAPAATAFEIQVDSPAQIAGYIVTLAEPDDARRKEAVLALARRPELALPALRAARDKATDENERWWIDAALQQIEVNGGTASRAGSASAAARK